MESGFGLGYYEDCRTGQKDAAIQEKSFSNESSAVDNIEDYMNKYLQQCLQYHEDQEALRQSQLPQTLPGMAEKAKKSVSKEFLFPTNDGKSTARFISGGVVVLEPRDGEQRGSGSSTQRPLERAPDAPGSPSEMSKIHSSSPPSQIAETSAEASSRMESLVVEGRRRAQEILLRFQQQQEQLLFNQPLVSPSTQNQDIRVKFPVHQVLMEPPEPSVFLEQRRRGMHREILIRKQAMLKNLEFVEEKTRKRSLELEEHIVKARKQEEEAKAQYEAAARRRKERINETLSTQAGLGTKKRKKAERIKEKEGHVPVQSSSDDPSTVAVYISGLPPDGSLTSEVVTELFGSFGRIKKVHFYVNKKTGQAKGDGLVIYYVESGGPIESTLIETVCSQVSTFALLIDKR